MREQSGATARDLELPAPVFGLLRALGTATMDAVFSGAGLSRVAELTAEAVGAPTAIVVPDIGVATVHPVESDPAMTAVTRYITDRIRGGPVRIPPEVRSESLVVRKRALVGGIALLADPGRVSPAVAAELLHVVAASVLAHVETVELRSHISSELAGPLIPQIRGDDPLDTRTLVWRAARLGTDLTEGAVALCVAPRHERPGRAVALVKSDHGGALVEDVDGRVLALIPMPRRERDAMHGRLQRTYARLRSVGPVGVSGLYLDAESMNHALDEAELMLEVSRDPSGAPTTDSPSHATYHLLFRLGIAHPDELRQLYESTVAPLVRYDEAHSTELLDTLMTYLDVDGNMNATGTRVFAHRHTVAYRLDRIRELTGLDPARTEHRERLGLGGKAYRILRP